MPGTDKIDLTFNVDEGKQFFVRRIDFSGNTTTRDKVIRRELLIDEGDMFNTRLWEVSILRLNQLGYFEQLKEEEAATIKRDTKTNTVDITLKVKERGKNSIQLNGGVSGIAGSFIGFSYSTNNFLGLGETLSIDSQLGDRIRNVTFGFTEPYFLDRPMQAGFTHLHDAVQLRPGPRSFAVLRTQPDPAVRAARYAESDELRFERLRLHDVPQLPDEEAQLRAPRPELRVRHVEHHDAERRFKDILRIPQLPGAVRIRCRASGPARSFRRSTTTRSTIRSRRRAANLSSSRPPSRAALWAATST